jgi:hypothetical protein
LPVAAVHQAIPVVAAVLADIAQVLEHQAAAVQQSLKLRLLLEIPTP